MSSGSGFRELRALRYSPPGFAGSDGRRTTFQAALTSASSFWHLLTKLVMPCARCNSSMPYLRPDVPSLLHRRESVNCHGRLVGTELPTVQT